MFPLPPCSESQGRASTYPGLLKKKALASRDVHRNLEAEAHFLIAWCSPGHSKSLHRWMSVNSSQRVLLQSKSDLTPFASLMPIETIPSQLLRLSDAISEGFLEDADSGHQVWWARGGAANGVPVCIVHGGPGGRSRPESAAWFKDTEAQWILMDQRGCGLSRPAGSLVHNTLNDLVQDMERLRIGLGHDKWALCGGSWGALVALRYAITYPQRVSGLMFRSPFLGTPTEINAFFEQMRLWLGEEGCSALGVECNITSASLLQKLAKLLDGSDEQAQMAASAWDVFETDLGNVGSLNTSGTPSRPHVWLTQRRPSQEYLATLISKFRLQAHYLSQACFLDQSWDQQLLKGFEVLAKLPVEIIQGDEDSVCPPETAILMRDIFPLASLSIVQGAGHNMDAAPIRQALVLAAQRLINRVKHDG